MSKSGTQWPVVHARDRSEWRRWLAENHATSDGVWLVYYKKGADKPTVSYEEAVEEALCYGWIDSRVNKVDEERYKQVFTPRKPGSAWAKSNKERVERLIRQGLMTPAGMEKVLSAQRDGSWNALDAVEELQMPSELAAAFDDNPAAYQHFTAFGLSARKMIIHWVESAKRPETRAKRIQQTVALAARNLKPY